MPWLGFFDKINNSDVFILADHVQFRNDGFQHRNKIKTAQGPTWLTVPVRHNGFVPLNKVRISRGDSASKPWYDRHLRTLEHSYGKAPYYDKYIGIIEEIYKRDYELLSDLNTELIKAILKILGIKTKIVMSEEAGVTSGKTEGIIEAAKATGADTYVSGIRGTRYLDEARLRENGINVVYRNYEHPVYNQLYMKIGFVPQMSIVDLLFNHGDDSLSIISNGSSSGPP